MAAAAQLRRLRDGLGGALDLGELAARLGSEGTGLLVILLSIPFLQPLPTGGLSVPAGLLIAAAGLQAARGADQLRLPAFVARKSLDEATLRRLLGLAEKAVGFLERAARPRGPAWARSPRLLGFTIAALGALLAVPFYLPFAAMVCALPLVLLGLALIEGDGACGALGLVAAAACAAYHAAVVRVAWIAASALARRVLR
jgi:hypothetical protein